MPIPGSTLLLLSLVAFVLLAVPTARGAARVNSWSVQYNVEVQERLATQVALPPPPARHPRATHWRAFRALEGGDAGTALALSQHLATVGDPMAPQIMARALEVRGDYSAAVGVWKQIGSADVLLRVAEAATQAGHPDAAQEAYHAAWELDPAGRSTGSLAKFLWKEQADPVAAEAVMRQSIAAYPGFLYRDEWLSLLGDILKAQGRWSEAAGVYQQIAVENPHDWKAYYEAAWAYQQSGQTDQAIGAIEQALLLESTDPRYYVARRAGQIYEAAGQPEKALAAYRRVLSLRPDDKTARQALERLTSNP